MRPFSILLVSLFLFVSLFGKLWADLQTIVDYHQGANGRAETVHAIIRAKDLGTGEPTSENREMAAQIRAMGKTGDDCGHIVANSLGGPMRTYNLFPQNAGKNRGEWWNTVEAHMKLFLELDKTANLSVDYHAELPYARSTDTRPTMIKFNIRFYNGTKLVPFNRIPVNSFTNHRVPSNPYVGAVLNP